MYFSHWISMLGYRNHRSRFTSVRDNVHMGWKEQLHSLSISHETGANIYGLNQRLIQMADECTNERKKFHSLEKNISVLKQLADSDYEFRHYVYILQQVTYLKMVLKWQFESLMIAKQELKVIEKKLHELQFPPIRALQTLQAEAIVEETICRDLRTEVGHLQHQLEQMEAFYGVEKPDVDLQPALQQFNFPDLHVDYTAFDNMPSPSRLQRFCRFFRKHIPRMCTCTHNEPIPIAPVHMDVFPDGEN